MYIYVYITSNKIFRENMNLHVFAGNTGHSGYAISFGLFFLY